MPSTGQYPLYGTKTFNQIWENASDWLLEYTTNYEFFIPANVGDDDLNIIFYLIASEFGNSPISQRSVEQFKLRFFKTCYQYFPKYKKQREIQDNLFVLSQDAIKEGNKQISNIADNPEYASSANTELDYVTNQHTSRVKKGILEANADLWNMLDSNIETEFLENFRPLFKSFIIDDTVFISQEEE